MVRSLADERVRFLLAGGVSALVTYGLFFTSELTIGKWIGYLGSLYLSYVLGVMFAFVLHRRYTFRAHRTGGSIVVDFLRFSSIYVLALVFNSAGLPLLVEVAHLSPLVAQAVVVILTPFITYVGHRYFSFARRTPPQNYATTLGGSGQLSVEATNSIPSPDTASDSSSAT